MATVNFLYRSKKDSAPLNLRLLFRYDNQDFALGGKTKLIVSKYYWTKVHKTNPRDIDLKNQQSKIKTNLNGIESFIIDAFNQVKNKSSLNKSWLNQQINFYYNNGTEENPIPEDLVSFIKYYIEERKHEVKPASVTKFNVIRNKMIRLEEYLGQTIFLKDINDIFKNKFAEYYKMENYSINTAQRELSIVKTFCKYAKRKGMNVNPEADFIKLPKATVPKIYLSFEELKEIEKTDLKLDHLKNARDWLIISCYTGQRVSDFMRFTKDMIRKEKGKQLLEFKQVKTGKLMTIPLLPKVIEILEKRKGNFPIAMSDQRYNEHIKVVCEEAKLKKKIEGKKQLNTSGEKDVTIMRNVFGSYEKHELVTSHIGRRSFATNYYGKIPTTFLIYVTGHSSESLFLNYIGKSNKDMAIELAGMFDSINI